MWQLLVPILAGIGAYSFQLWMRIVSSRRQQSAIAVTYLSEIRNEVLVGIGRLKYLYKHGGVPQQYGNFRPIMPTKVWSGVRETIPDDILGRLCNVCRHSSAPNEMDDIRWHLKNYYTVVCKYGNDVIEGRLDFNKEVVRVDLDGSRMVLKLVENAEKMMKENSGRILWPW